jgi:hypothetical protein
MLDLPVPLRPMMHTRSPRAICQDTLSNNGMAPKARDTSLNLSRVMSFSKNGRAFYLTCLDGIRIYREPAHLVELNNPIQAQCFHPLPANG